MIKPLPGYCLVEPIEDTGRTASGLYTPEVSADKPMKGKIVDVSYFVKDEANISIQWFEKKFAQDLVKKGVTVVYKKWTNQEVEHEGKMYLLIHFNELLGVIE